MANELIERNLLETVMANLTAKEAIAIRGPRQSGKSTLLKMLQNKIISSGIDKSNVIYLSFEDPNVLDEFVKDPLKYLSSFLIGNGRHYFLLDEVQYDKQAGRHLKLVYDTMPEVKLVVTGSSTLDINEITKYMVGRVFLYELMPLSFGEYLRYKNKRLYNLFAINNAKFRKLLLEEKEEEFEGISVNELESYLEDYILYGGYPEVVKSQSKQRKVEVLKNIYLTYIEKDIPGIFGIADTQLLRKTILYFALNIGNLLEYNSIASDVGIYYSKLLKYMSILEDTYVAMAISPFYKNRITELKKSKKLYFFDTGLRNYIAQNFNKLEMRDDAGRLFENFAAIELRQIAEPTQSINYWRTTAKAEVDFVFNRQSSQIPIEIKRTQAKRQNVERSMKSFIDAYKPKVAVIAGRGVSSSIKVGETEVHFPSIAYI